MIRAEIFPLALTAALIGALGSGCRGDVSDRPPIHPNPNMDFQQRFDAQEANPLFADGRAMRPQVPGTVARGELDEDEGLYRGRQGEAYRETLPVELSAALLARGRQRFDIYCLPCHDGAGTGKGLVIQRGFLPPPNFHDERLRTMPVGQIFEAITNGVRNMPPYRAQIPVDDRWAIVAWVRALQVSQTAALDMVPADVAAQKGWKP